MNHLQHQPFLDNAIKDRATSSAPLASGRSPASASIRIGDYWLNGIKPPRHGAI